MFVDDLSLGSSRPPRVELGAQYGHAGGFSGGEILLLMRVVGHTVEFRVAFLVLWRGEDELPAVLENPAPAQVGRGFTKINEIVGVALAVDCRARTQCGLVGEVEAGKCRRGF